jgi:oxygen-dependent protoporphyrinogen oxidase
VGAGIAGLAAAHAVRRERPDVEVVVLEASDRVGGKLLLGEVAGVQVDLGAESILNRRPEGVELARAAGLGDRVTHPATTEARVWSRGELHRLPRSVMGVPADMGELAESGIVSRKGQARAAMDLALPATTIEADDVSVGWLIEQRLGREVLDRLVEPLLGGVYAGHAREISARAAAPQVVSLLERDSSLMRAASAALQGPASGTPVFAGIVGGVGRLPQALATGLDVRTGVTVRDLARTATGWSVVTGPVPAPELLEADAVVVAVPGAPAARLLADVAPGAAMELASIEYASMAVVTLAVRASEMPPVDGSGFLVPPVDGRQVKAATWSFAKWDWVRESGAVADEDVMLLRASIGRHREERQLQVDDEELVARTRTDLRDAVGLTAEPVDTRVTRWGGGLPQYAVGHVERVSRIRDHVGALPGLAVCGAAYDGLGIPACIASAEKAVRQVLDVLPVTGAVGRVRFEGQ